MIDFIWYKMFILLPLPFVIRLFSASSNKGKGEAMKVPFFYEVKNLKGVYSRYRIRPNQIIIFMMYLIWSLIVVAGARPCIIGSPKILNNKSRDLMLVLDISGSMSIPDYKIDEQYVERLLIAQKISSDFVERRISDRIGLILFGTRPYLYVPLTLDKKTIKEMLFSAFPAMAGPQTATGDALALAVKNLYERDSKQKAIILLSDGHSNIGNVSVEQAISLAVRSKIKVYTIGFGSNKETLRTPDGVIINNLNDYYDEAELKQIAVKTGGAFFKAETTEELVEVYNIIDSLEPLNEDDFIIRPKIEIYHYFLSLALIISIMSAAFYFREKQARW
ncbi:MAG: VWA domain-containing protein [Alphaproteobacteria bacterium]